MTGSGPTFEPSAHDGEDELLPQPPAARRGRAWLALATVAVLAAVVGFAVTRPHHGTHPQARPDATASELQLPPPPRLDTTDPVVLPPTGPLPDVGDVRLFARAADAVVEINFAAGWIVASPLPTLRSSGPVTFGVTATGTYVRPLDAVPGYFVPDAGVARELTGQLSAAAVLPGPDLGSVWIEESHGDRLTGLRAVYVPTSAATSVSLSVPASDGPLWGPPTSDGSGYVLLSGGHGSFDLRPDGAHRLPDDLTRSTILASGGDRLLVAACSPPQLQSCPVSLIGLPDGTRTRLGSLPVTAALPAGTISADTALIYQAPVPGRLDVRLLDLRTGHFRGLPVAVDPDTEPGSAVFSSDGRWAFVVSVGGTLTALDVRTGVAQRISANLPHLYQLAARG